MHLCYQNFLLKLVKLITEVMVKPEYSANPSKKSMWEVIVMIREHNEVSIDKAMWDWLTGKPMDQWNRIENSEISQLPWHLLCDKGRRSNLEKDGQLCKWQWSKWIAIWKKLKLDSFTPYISRAYKKRYLPVKKMKGMLGKWLHKLRSFKAFLTLVKT